MTKLSLQFTSLVVCGLGAALHATPVEFAADPAASRITVSGSYEGSSFSAQMPGSDTTSYTGTIRGDLTGNSLLLEWNNVESVYQPQPQRPGRAETGEETQRAAYGLTFVPAAGGAGSAALPSLWLMFGNPYQPLDVGDGTFVAGDAGFFIGSGEIHLLKVDSGTRDQFGLHGFGAPNVATLPGTLTMAGNLQTLTIPLSSTFSTSKGTGPMLTLTLEGQIVATRLVPEPAGAAAVVAWCGWLLARRRPFFIKPQ